MNTSSRADGESETCLRRQEVVVELGTQALESDDFDGLLEDAAAAVADTLGTEYCAVLELLPDGNEVLLRHGAGWRNGLIGSATAPADEGSLPGRTLRSEEPIVVGDLYEENHFSDVELPSEQEVVSAVSVVVGPVDDPWGVLGAFATERRRFTEHDAGFVRSVANILASAIENERARNELEETYDRISDAYVALDEEWRFVRLNERARELIDPDGRTLVGENVWEEFPEAIGRDFESMLERAMNEREHVSFEEYYPEPLDAWFEVRAYPTETGLSVYFRDVSDREELERGLEEEERRFEAIFDDPNILVGLLEPDGTVLDINRTAMEYVDADLDAVTGEPFWETPWWGEDDRVQTAVREWAERAAAGEYVEFEADLTRPDGNRYVLEGVFRPVTDDDGDVVSIIVSDRDVTERHEYERQLAESERRYRTLAEHFPNGIVTLFDDDLRYTLAAGRAFDSLPVSRDDLEGGTPREVWAEENADVLEPAFEAALDGEERSVELAYAGREWVVHAVPIVDERGNVFAGMTMAQDITEQKEREEFLRDAKEQLEAATEAGAVGTWEWKIPEDRFVAGESFARKFGVDPEAARDGVPLEQFVSSVHEADRERVAAAIEEAVETCGKYEEEYRVWNVDGEARWVVARGHVECDEDGEPVTFPGALTDITERKRAERALQETVRKLEASNERLEQFAYAASHDLQEPLRMVSSYLQLLEARYAEDLDEDAHEFIEFAVDGAERMREMIDGLLEYSRVETQGNPFEPVDLDALLAEVREDLQVKIDEGDADITADRLPRVSGDAGQLRQVFQNLIDNAIEYSGDEPPRVHVSAERDGSEWVVSVADEGVGIAPENEDRVFEVFQRLHGRGEHPGLGIGLALCRRIVERHDGEIWVDSTPGEGATFSFTLPDASAGDRNE